MQHQKQKIEKVSKPYLKGSMVDRGTPGGVLKFFAGTVIMSVLFLIIGVMMNWGQQWLNISVNLFIVLGVYLFFHQMGAGSGAEAVSQGEIMFTRQQKGRPVADWERQLCYHPLKGLIAALLGSLPLFLASLILACITERQFTMLGALPSWVGGLEGREEIGAALMYYHENTGMSFEAILRLVIRMSTMPYVNMIGAENRDGMLLLERISPLLSLLPALAYGVGYMGGVSVRTSVHTNIALGKKKAQRKQAKERRSRQQTRRGPEQLN